MAEAATRRSWIIDQLDLLMDIADGDNLPPRKKILEAADSLIGEEPFHQIPDTNARAEQSNWLQALWDAAVKQAGGAVLVGKKDPTPSGGQWDGDPSGPPPGFPGR